MSTASTQQLNNFIDELAHMYPTDDVLDLEDINESRPWEEFQEEADLDYQQRVCDSR